MAPRSRACRWPRRPFCLRDDSLTDVDNLPAPGVIAAEIVEGISAALDAFTDLADSLEAIGDPE